MAGAADVRAHARCLVSGLGGLLGNFLPLMMSLGADKASLTRLLKRGNLWRAGGGAFMIS